MKEYRNSIISGVALFLISLILNSCTGMKNLDRPIPGDE